jgi:hypothetical protein
MSAECVLASMIARNPAFSRRDWLFCVDYLF